MRGRVDKVGAKVNLDGFNRLWQNPTSPVCGAIEGLGDVSSSERQTAEALMTDGDIPTPAQASGGPKDVCLSLQAYGVRWPQACDRTTQALLEKGGSPALPREPPSGGPISQGPITRPSLRSPLPQI